LCAWYRYVWNIIIGADMHLIYHYCYSDQAGHAERVNTKKWPTWQSCWLKLLCTQQHTGGAHSLRLCVACTSTTSTWSLLVRVTILSISTAQSACSLTLRALMCCGNAWHTPRRATSRHSMQKLYNFYRAVGAKVACGFCVNNTLSKWLSHCMA
jgi:hypothetical protein